MSDQERTGKPREVAADEQEKKSAGSLAEFLEEASAEASSDALEDLLNRASDADVPPTADELPPSDEPPENTEYLPKPAIEAEVEVTADELRAKPSKRRRRASRGPGHSCLVAAAYAAFILGISMILSSFIILFTNEIFAFVKPDITTVVEVTGDDTFTTISEKLKDAGLIKYPALFNLYLHIAKSGAKFEPGQYEVSAKLDYPAIARAMRKSTVRKTVRVTIPEGYTTAQIVTLLAQKNVCSEEALYNAIETETFDYEWLTELGEGKTRLEGYLFPDTYEFYVEDDAKTVLDKFLANFGAKYDEELRAATAESSYTLRQIVIIASMIEREALLSEERPVIASVIYNRLNSRKFPYLQIDATVAYILGRAPTDADLTIDDPYNTYVYKGLPPGPIANPGLASIRAALDPKETGYFFYVARRDGSHIFSRTAAEHEAAIKEVSGQ